MNQQDRRTFLADVGKGMLVASVGPALAAEMGLARAAGADGPTALSFDHREPLVGLLQETPPNKLLPILVDKLKSGMELKELVASAALANARTFGGENYLGFHVFMALKPAYQLAQELPAERQALPVLKVLYRNATGMQAVGCKKGEKLTTVPMAEKIGPDAAEKLRLATNKGDKATAERILAALAKQSPEAAFNAVLLGVEDNHDVHSVVLPWRAWAVLDLVGKEHALTLLRQSVRKCAGQNGNPAANQPEIAKRRAMLPRLLDQHRLIGRPLGNRSAEASWIDQMVATILLGKPEAASDAVAAAFAEGFAPEQVGEAISLAATQLVLRQVENWTGGNHSYGRRTHGDSLGVHASDTVNAWRNMARVSNPRNRVAGLIMAAFDVAQSIQYSESKTPRGHQREPFPRPEQVARVVKSDSKDLLAALHDAIRASDQLGAAAIVARYGELGHAVRPVFDVLLGYAVSEDGRLHGEKYYRTVSEEFATTRPAYRWQHLTALARVTASAYGLSAADKREGRAPGYEEACKLLRV